MILRLTASCNNRCFFCIVDDEIASTSHRPTADLLAEIDATPAAETIDVFGGEPTIDPSFWAVMERAVETGRVVTLATNARAFANGRWARRLASLGDPDRIVVRTTLMGPEAELHDRLNGASNAFGQTTRGISALQEAGFDVRVNIVILEENVALLLDTALLAMELGCRRIKFSGAVRTGKFRSSVPSPETVRAALRAAVPVLSALGVRVSLEKLPLCVAGEHARLVQREDLPWCAANPFFAKPWRCTGCAVERGCPGAERGALERYGERWIDPFTTLPPGTVELDWDEVGSYAPVSELVFVRIRPESVSVEKLADATLAIDRFSKRFPAITVV